MSLPLVVLFMRLATFNVLAALATGGFGVCGLEPACGLCYVLFMR